MAANDRQAVVHLIPLLIFKILNELSVYYSN